MGGIDYHLTGADLDEAALKLRMDIQKDLHEILHGDLCSMAFPAESFDVVYSAYVLEHIRDADVALNNMLSSLQSGGLLVVRVPDPDTARGLVTRNTPFWFHVLYHRWVMKRPKAGTPGYAPYPTYYHPVISKRGMQAYASSRGLEWVAIFPTTSCATARDWRGFCFVAVLASWNCSRSAALPVSTMIWSTC